MKEAVHGYLQTGQTSCHDPGGAAVSCTGSGQDGEFRRGLPWPEPRFEVRGAIVLDRLTGLSWTRNATPGELPMTWREALAFVAAMNRERALGFSGWRLPNRRELRSLVSHQTRRPALPEGAPFRQRVCRLVLERHQRRRRPCPRLVREHGRRAHVLRRQGSILPGLAGTGRKPRATGHRSDAVL